MRYWHIDMLAADDHEVLIEALIKTIDSVLDEHEDAYVHVHREELTGEAP
jgi:hypothetical protein